MAVEDSFPGPVNSPAMGNWLGFILPGMKYLLLSGP